MRDALPDDLLLMCDLPLEKVLYNPESAGVFDLADLPDLMPHCDIGGPAYPFRATLLGSIAVCRKRVFLLAGAQARAQETIGWMRRAGFLA